MLARAEAAQLAIKDITTVADPIIERYEREPPLPPGPRISSTNPVEVAGIARRAAGEEQPWINLAPIMDTFGVRYLEESMREGLSGLVLYVNDTPIIAVRAQDTDTRKRFSAAHERGLIDRILASYGDALIVLHGTSEEIESNLSDDSDWKQIKERAEELGNTMLELLRVVGDGKPLYRYALI